MALQAQLGTQPLPGARHLDHLGEQAHRISALGGDQPDAFQRLAGSQPAGLGISLAGEQQQALVHAGPGLGGQEDRHRSGGTNVKRPNRRSILTSIGYAPPLLVGLNCSLGPDEMDPFIEELARVSPFYVGAYPNAGLPDPLSETGFPETPETLAPKLEKWARNGWLNLVGGCCGTTPDHIRALAKVVHGVAPRMWERPQRRDLTKRTKQDFVRF